MEEFCLINKYRDRKKVLKPFNDITKPSSVINAIEIQYAWVYKRSSNPVIKVQELNPERMSVKST